MGVGTLHYHHPHQPSPKARQNCIFLLIQTYQFGGRNMWGNSPDDTSQNMIQLIILLISVACIPLMLIPKPWIEISRMKKHRAKYVKLS